MTCATHPELEATGFCRNCGKALCPTCTREVNGALYCEPCLGALVAGTPQLPPPMKPGSNPGLAAVLGIIPGLGAVYNGQILKGVIHVLIFGGLIAMVNSDMPGGFDAFFGIAIAFFCLYMPVEAYRTAKARQLGEPEPPNLVEGPSSKPIGAFILIAIGALLLMANFGLLQHDWFSKTWPLALIAVGGWLVWDRTKKDS